MTGFFILSFGRSGSVLLAHNVGRSVGILPSYAHRLEDLGGPVVHSHLQLPADCFSGYQRIFNLRANPIDTVLSFCMTRHYKQFHLFKDQERPSLKPFSLDTRMVVLTIQDLIDWHNHYATQLTDTDLVIVYEQMIDTIADAIYNRTYPDKQELILNYHEAVSICQKHIAQMQHSIGPFLKHQNQQDIGHMIR